MSRCQASVAQAALTRYQKHANCERSDGVVRLPPSGGRSRLLAWWGLLELRPTRDRVRGFRICRPAHVSSAEGSPGPPTSYAEFCRTHPLGCQNVEIERQSPPYGDYQPQGRSALVKQVVRLPVPVRRVLGANDYLIALVDSTSIRRRSFVGDCFCISGIGRAVMPREGVVCLPVCPAFPLGFLARACGGGGSGDGGCWWAERGVVEPVELVFPRPVPG